MHIRRPFNFALALAIAGMATAAGAQETVTTINADVTTPQTWCDNETTMFLAKPIFVFSKLTILPGCIVRGNPRTVAFNAATPTVGSPGTLVISEGGYLDAQGTPADPIIMTTAAIDVNDDGIADDSNGAAIGIDPWNGNPADFYDDTPKTNPLAGLDTAGNQNASIWGGLVLLGRAPINNGNDTVFGYGKRGIEGLNFPGYPVNGGRYGGYQPHDTSGIVRYVSVRYAGDEIGNGNELNGISLAGVGDGTIIENVEVLFNADDGIEIFGGTVDVRNAVIAYVGDDSLDIDEGYTGTVQNVLMLQNFFKEDDGGTIGTANGDAIGEWDGDDCGEFNCNIQIDSVSLVSPPAPTGSNGLSWPNAYPGLYNMTGIGPNALSGGANPAVVPFAGQRGWRMRRGFMGAVHNSIVTNTVTLACNVELGATSAAMPAVQVGLPGQELDLIRVVSSTIADSAGTGAAGCAAAATAGDNAVASGSEFDGGTANFLNVVGDILVNENTYFAPKGVVSNGRGKLLGSKVGSPTDPRPANPGAANMSGGVRPRGRGLDASATYRGAFPAGQPLWTNGWTALSKGGILVNN